MLKAILFDLGNTLIATPRGHLWSLFEQGAREAYDWLGEQGCRLPSFGRYYRLHQGAMALAFVKSRMEGGEVSCGRLLGQLARHLDLDLLPAQIEEMAWRWYRPLAAQSTVGEEVRPALEEMRGEGLALGIISNTFVPGTVLDRHLKAVGLLEYFPHRFYSGDLGQRKPNRQIFRLALQAVGCPARQAVFVGDSLRNDVVGAQRAGLLAVLLRPGSESHTHPIADHVIRHLGELCRLLPLLHDGRRGR